MRAFLSEGLDWLVGKLQFVGLLLILAAAADNTLAEGVVKSSVLWRVQWASCGTESPEAAASCATAVYSGGGAYCSQAGHPGPPPFLPFFWRNGRLSANGVNFFFDIHNPCNGAFQNTMLAELDRCPANSGRSGTNCVCNAQWTPVPTSAGLGCVRIVHMDKTAHPPTSCRAQMRIGNPIAPGTGAKILKVPTNVTLGGKELTMTYDSTHSSQARGTRPEVIGSDRPAYEIAGLGGAWSTNFHQRLLVDGNGRSAALIRGDGTVEAFQQDGSGRFNSLSPTYPGYIEASGTTYRHVDHRSQTVGLFGTDGRLLSESGASGTVITYAYSDAQTDPLVAPGSGYMISATDSVGRSIQFHYASVSSNNTAPYRLRKVVDTSNRSMTLLWRPAGESIEDIEWADATRFSVHAEDPRFPWAVTGTTGEDRIRLASYDYDDLGRAVSTRRGRDADAYAVSYGLAGPRVAFSDEFLPMQNIVLRRHSWAHVPQVGITLPNRQTSLLSFASAGGFNALTSASQPAGSGCAESVSRAGYDDTGRPRWSDDQRGFRTCFNFDPRRGLEVSRVEGLMAEVDCASVDAPSA